MPDSDFTPALVALSELRRRRLELAMVFELASRRSPNIIDPPFDCITINLTPETWAEVAALLRDNR